MINKEETVNIAQSSARVSGLPKLLAVSPSPHVRGLETVTSVMADVIIALLPALAWGIYHSGIRVLFVVLLSVATSVVCELVYELIAKRPVRIGDLSSVVTGLMLGLMLPSGVSLWVPVAGAVFAVIVAKQLFGGIGSNIVNPAIAARIFLMLCFPAQMVKYVDKAGDLMSSATPLVNMKAGENSSVSLFNLVIGNCAGAIGEVSAIAIGAGFMYLLVRKVISWEIPASFIGTVVLISAIFPKTGDSRFAVFQAVAGSLLFAAVFSAGDTVTTPVTRLGKLIFGVGCGIVTLIIRYFCPFPDGTAFAILLMNLLVPLFNEWTKPVRFGGRNEKRN